MSFYKMQSGQNEFLFQLANLEPAKEEYVFWKEGLNRPIRDNVNGMTAKDAYWLPKDKWIDARHPIAEYRPDRSFLREIIITQGGIPTQYMFSFKKRDTLQLDTEISNIVNIQRKNPLAFNFKFRKTGQGIDTIRVVMAMNEIGLPQSVQLSQNLSQSPITLEQANKQYDVVEPQKVPIMQPNVATMQSSGLVLSSKPSLTLDADEQRIMDYFKQHPTKFSEEQFMEVFNATLSKESNRMNSTERLKEIFKLY